MNIRAWVEAPLLILGLVLCVMLAMFSARHIWLPGMYAAVIFALVILIRIDVFLIRYWK